MKKRSFLSFLLVATLVFASVLFVQQVALAEQSEVSTSTVEDVHSHEVDIVATRAPVCHYCDMPMVQVECYKVIDGVWIGPFWDWFCRTSGCPVSI